MLVLGLHAFFYQFTRGTYKSLNLESRVIKNDFEIVILVTESSQKLTLQGVVELISLTLKPSVSN